MTPSNTELDQCTANLSRNGFDVYRAAGPQHARSIFNEQILPQLDAKSVAWGDSQTMHATGVLDDLFAHADIEMILTFGDELEREEKIRNRRLALHADLFLSGCNALTGDGKLVNLDMIGNRCGPIAYGPHAVVLFVGRNKLTPDLPAAMARVRNIAAPLNARRHRLETPCAKSGRCHDCAAPQRICNTWTILEKCFPKGRVKVVLIDADLGL